MLDTFLSTYIHQELPFEPNEGQEALLGKLSAFLVSPDPRKAFVLKGYAGTGKTSVVSALVRALEKLRQPCVLLAPTGRAAKVIAGYSGRPAYTIHKKIYRQNKLGESKFSLTDNLHRRALFIVDEASMINNMRQFDNPFGSGNLLQDLIKFVYSGQGCSLLLLGDTAQLPPVGQTDSPALQENVLAGYMLNVTEHMLTQVARQALDSGILKNATDIRQQLQEGQIQLIPTFTTKGYTDIERMKGEEFLEVLEESYNEVGMEQTVILTRTNRRTNLYNQGIRARVLWKEELLTGGDRLMVSRNNYYWTEPYENLDFLANGDMLTVNRVRNEREMYGFHFVDVELLAEDYDFEIEATVWLDTLTTESPEQSYQMQQTLWQRIAEDYPEVRDKRELWKLIMQSPYYNALQVRFAYAVTCHKAQGGQWKRVFIDPGMVDDEHLGEDFYRWLYTALTRAQEKVYLIGFPDEKQ
ncbi:MAG: AAA family ATPase [Bacteroidales bacterium]|nr:AAA family ATPase [Candidatus Colicola faecequi]